MKPEIITAYVNHPLDVTVTLINSMLKSFTFHWFIDYIVCDDFNSTNCVARMNNPTVTGSCGPNNSMTLSILNISEWHLNKTIECRVYPARKIPYTIEKQIL